MIRLAHLLSAMMLDVLCLVILGRSWLPAVMLVHKVLGLVMIGLGGLTVVVIDYKVLRLVMIGPGRQTAVVLEMAGQLAVVVYGHISVDYTVTSCNWYAAIHLSQREFCIGCGKIVVAIVVDRLIPGT